MAAPYEALVVGGMICESNYYSYFRNPCVIQEKEKEKMITGNSRTSPSNGARVKIICFFRANVSLKCDPLILYRIALEINTETKK